MKNAMKIFACLTAVLCIGSAAALSACGEGELTWSLTKAPTCTEEGIFSGTDNGGRVQKTHTVPATGHSYCYEIVKAPSFTTAGSAVGVCQKDGAEKTVALPPLTEADYLIEEKAATLDSYAANIYTLKTEPELRIPVKTGAKLVPQTASEAVSVAQKSSGGVVYAEGVRETEGAMGKSSLSFGYQRSADYTVVYEQEDGSAFYRYFIVEDGVFYCLEENGGKPVLAENYDANMADGYAYTLDYATGFYGEKDAAVYYGTESFLSGLYKLAQESVNKPAKWERADGRNYSFSFGYLRSAAEGTGYECYCEIEVSFTLDEGNALASLEVVCGVYEPSVFTVDGGKVTIKSGFSSSTVQSLSVEQKGASAEKPIVIDELYVSELTLYDTREYDVQTGETLYFGEIKGTAAKPYKVPSETYGSFTAYYTVNQGASTSFDPLHLTLIGGNGNTPVVNGVPVEGAFTATVRDGEIYFENVHTGVYTLEIRTERTVCRVTFSYDDPERPDPVSLIVQPDFGGSSVYVGTEVQFIVSAAPDHALSEHTAQIVSPNAAQAQLTKNQFGKYVFIASAAGEYELAFTSQIDTSVKETVTLSVSAYPTVNELFGGRYDMQAGLLGGSYSFAFEGSLVTVTDPDGQTGVYSFTKPETVADGTVLLTLVRGMGTLKALKVRDCELYVDFTTVYGSAEGRLVRADSSPEAAIFGEWQFTVNGERYTVSFEKDGDSYLAVFTDANYNMYFYTYTVTESGGVYTLVFTAMGDPVGIDLSDSSFTLADGVAAFKIGGADCTEFVM